MALSIMCEQGHRYIQGDLYVDWPEGLPKCPKCAEEWKARKANRDESRVQLTDVQRLHLNPGDVLALSYDGSLPYAEKQRIVETMKRLFPDNRSVILERGLSLSVVEPTE